MKKHKRIKIYTAITGIVLIGVIGYFFCYKDYKVNKIMNESIECINQKQYDKAISGIDSALSTKPDDEKAKGLKDSVNKYLIAKNLYSNNKLDEANLKANEISDYYNINGFKEDVDSLKNQINTSIEKRKEQIEKEKREKEIEIEKQKDLEKKQLVEKEKAKKENDKISKEENSKKEESSNLKNKTTTNNEKVKANLEEKSVSESRNKKVEKNTNENNNNNNALRFKKTLTKDEALVLIKEKLGTKKKYEFEGISASELEGIFALFRSSKTLYAVNLYNGEIADANTGEIYAPASR